MPIVPEATSERQETPLGAPQIYVENVGVTPPSVPREVVDDDVDDGEAESKCCQPSETTMFVLTVIFILPIGVICLSFIFGGLLAAVEGWNIMDGFYYSVSALCGLPEALTDVSPDSTSGKYQLLTFSFFSLTPSLVQVCRYRHCCLVFVCSWHFHRTHSRDGLGGEVGEQHPWQHRQEQHNDPNHAD